MSQLIASQMTKNTIQKITAFTKATVNNTQSAYHFTLSMPKLLKQTGLILAAASFTAAFSVSVVTLAPDQLDYERKSQLEEQFSARTAQLSAENIK